MEGACSVHTNCNYIFYSPSCRGQETVKGFLRSSSQAVTCLSVYHTRWRLYTIPFIAERQAKKAVNTNFFLVFVLTRPRIEA